MTASRTEPPPTAPASPGWLRRRGTGPGGVVAELAVVAVALLANAGVRALTLDSREQALANARTVLGWQQALGLDVEHAVQDATLDVPWLTALLSWFYVWGYFPLVLAALVALYAVHAACYATYRNALLVSGALGLLVYTLFPCAPPRLTDLGYVDTLAGGPLGDAARPAGLANELGAMPSFHVGWLVVAAVVLFRVSRSLVLRLACVLVPLLMSYAVVATGNHWVLDVFAGVALALVGLLVADRLAASPAVSARA